jgi:hypothetical protein
MRPLRFLLPGLVTASLLAACSGANSGAPAGSLPPALSRATQAKLPPFLRLGHTPARPPVRKYKVTAAMRARAKAGGWQELNAPGPFAEGAGTEMLMTDGTVLVQDYCGSATNWWKLTPDKTGSYLNGTWSEIPSMPSNYGPLYFASAILPDGKLIVNGGEYLACAGAETNEGAIYDPVANAWTAVSGPSGWAEIGDGQSVILANGTYMIGNCCYTYQALYNEGSSTWTQVDSGKHDANSEEGWTLLRSGEVLTADVISAPYSELFNPKTSSWSAAGDLPVNITQAEEIGPQPMMPTNIVFAIGANQDTALYNAGNGKWTQGPNFPIVSGQQYDVADGPASVLPNGQVMVAGSVGVYSTPAAMFLFTGKKFKDLPNPPGIAGDSSYNIRLLLLPTGQVLFADGSNDVEIFTNQKYQKPLSGTEPIISSVPTSLMAGSTYKLTGRYLGGFTQANFYGDDDQQATNFPLVRITNSSTGDVFYAKTHGFSSMAIGSPKRVSTQFDVPAGIDTGAASLVVVTNGVASTPVSVTIGSSK